MADRRPVAATDRRLLAGSVAAFVLALALRLWPLSRSPLPFNPDGVGYAATARTVLATGRLPLAGMATDQVGYTGLTSLVAALAGDPALTVAQPTSAAIGAATVLVGVAVARRLARAAIRTADWSRPRARTRQAALLAGALLAVEGLYLYRSMPTDEQTAGLLLVPALVVALDRWLSTARGGWLALAALSGVALAPLHNLSGLVGALAVTVVAAVHVVRAPATATALRAGLAAGVAWTYAVGYHLAVAAATPAVIVQSDRIASVPGLVVAWVVLAVVGAAWHVTTTRRLQRASVVGVVAVLFGLLAANAVRTVYPGTATTPRLLLVALLPLVVPAVLAGAVADRAGGTRAVGATAVGLVAGPLALVGVSLTAGLEFRYLAMAYRAQLFVHLPVLALAGLGTVAAARRLDRPPVAAALVVVVVVAAAASAPAAYSGLELLTYKGTTTEAEFGAAAFAASNFEGFATDDHLARVANYHGGGGGDGPTYRWLRGGGPPPPCPVLAQDSWTTTGAQVHPQPPARIDAGTYRDWRVRNDVVYVATGDDPVRAVLPRGNASAGCS